MPSPSSDKVEVEKNSLVLTLSVFSSTKKRHPKDRTAAATSPSLSRLQGESPPKGTFNCLGH